MAGNLGEGCRDRSPSVSDEDLPNLQPVDPKPAHTIWGSVEDSSVSGSVSAETLAMADIQKQRLKDVHFEPTNSESSVTSADGNQASESFDDTGCVLPSLGSRDHDKGTCRPCPFHNAKIHCRAAADCEFCHMPHTGTCVRILRL
mmetsp:Transcript_114099/g.317625  ORF Transcript_114099/g.317625 Transcript_114099/m.317625 type:complete len:145 (-) Transcript_114099:198-632(-)